MCSHKATNSCSIGFMTGKNRIFKPPKCRKWVRTKPGTLEREFQDSAVNVFSRRQNARSELTRCVVRVWPWPLTFDPGREIALFAWPLNFVIVLKLSLFQVAIKEKMCSHEATYPWSMGLTTRQKSHFQAAKMQKMCSHEAT